MAFLSYYIQCQEVVLVKLAPLCALWHEHCFEKDY